MAIPRMLTRICCAAALVTCSAAASGQVNVCSYFRLKPQVSGSGQKAVSVEAIDLPDDAMAGFIAAHSQRFDYLIYNRVDSIWMYARLLPDTVMVSQAFCRALYKPAGFEAMFQMMIPGAHSGKKQSLSFSEEEMMQVASRFFYCDEVLPLYKIQSHICVGIHGQKEWTHSRDYTLLEAFCIEAIFATMRGKTGKLYYRHFDDARAAGMKQAKGKEKDANAYLLSVRQDVFAAMEKDENLKSAVLEYYRANEDNLGFEIAGHSPKKQ